MLVVGLARQGAIRFDAVRFSYPARPGAEVLKGLTLDIAAGQTVAVVGASGQSTPRAMCIEAAALMAQAAARAR